MGEKLKKPPIIEAVCEFRFDPSSPWDWTIPGRLYDKIGDDFSERSQVRGLGIQLQVGPGKAPTTQIHAGADRVQLKRPDGSAMVQVGPHLLAINHLRPYPQWETFRDLILDVFKAHCSVSKKASLSRIGLRYINQIPLPGDRVDFSSFITVDPPLSGLLDRPLVGFYQRYEIVQGEPNGVLIHQTGLQRVDDRQVLVIDLDFGSQEVGHLDNTQGVAAWLDAAHDRVHEAFVASLNPGLYDAMKRGET